MAIFSAAFIKASVMVKLLQFMRELQVIIVIFYSYLFFHNFSCYDVYMIIL